MEAALLSETRILYRGERERGCTVLRKAGSVLHGLNVVTSPIGNYIKIEQILN
jgi:hypothetical protein